MTRIHIHTKELTPASLYCARAYRIGQKRPVIVYRLITCGTVEEKIYRKQVLTEG